MPSPRWRFQAVLFVALVALGVVARWLQPAFGVTPTAALAVFAGFYFASRATAVALPVLVLAISDLARPAHNDLAIMATVYLAMVLPVALGARLRRGATLPRLGTVAFGPAVIFFLVTNFAVWVCHPWYPHTTWGLVECYLAGVPFFRSMLVGDLFYLAVVFGTYAAAVGRVGRRPVAVVRGLAVSG